VSFDPLEDERVSPTVSVPRDEKGNPLVIPRRGTVAIPYSRASGLSDNLTYFAKSLADWRGRYEAQGIARYRDIAAKIASVFYSTGPLSGTMPISARQNAASVIDECRAEAAERMGISEAANLGTAGHSLTEPGSEGLVVEELAGVVKGYKEITAGLERVASEVFVVNDELKAAGTFDSMYRDVINFPSCFIVGDTKTGKNYHQAEFEIQLAVYQGGELYLGADGGRLTFEEAFGLPVNADVAYLVHVSVTGAPKPRIVKLDLARGRRLAQLAADVRDGRKEIDATGIGDKLDHKGLASLVLEQQFEALFNMTNEENPEYISAEQFRERSTALWYRFEHVWPAEYTARVKARLS